MVEELYASYYEELRKFLVKQTRSYAEAEDITQEAFLKAVEHETALEKLSGPKRRAWLYRTAKNLLIDRMRHKNREPEWESPSSGGEDLTQIEVQQLLGTLSARDRSIFWMKYYGGYRTGEIAELFGMTAENVRTRLSLSRKLLKLELRKCEQN